MMINPTAYPEYSFFGIGFRTDVCTANHHFANANQKKTPATENNKFSASSVPLTLHLNTVNDEGGDGNYL